MAPHTPTARRTARFLGLLSVLTYNWWVGAVAVGLMPSPDGMFSDLEATGVPHASVFEHLDVASGLLICVGLMVLGPPVANERVREWKLLMGFGLAGVIGGMYPYACPEGRDDACRAAEWTFQLPLHHYIHMVSGIAEFGFATLAIVLIWRRLHDGAVHVWSTTASALAIGLLVGYPALALSYLIDRWDAPVEAFFFVLFAGVVAMVFLEPDADEIPQETAATRTRSAPATPCPAQRPPSGQDCS
ncbi:MAG TPA: DUF998 domain-containing protein [Nocardioides sp.]|nr:DUF998 domain-containing protein [Nocardioides sp.]